MEIVVEKGSKGNLMVVVRFGSAKNFNKERGEWIPRLSEIDLLSECKEIIMVSEKNKIK